MNVDVVCVCCVACWHVVVVCLCLLLLLMILCCLVCFDVVRLVFKVHVCVFLLVLMSLFVSWCIFACRMEYCVFWFVCVLLCLLLPMC